MREKERDRDTHIQRERGSPAFGLRERGIPAEDPVMAAVSDSLTRGNFFI